MVKGMSRRVVVVRSPDTRVFDEAIFIVKEDALHRGVTDEEILRQAQEIAGEYIAANRPRRLISRMPPAAFTLVGAGITALVWVMTKFIF